jgi:hypothetical protein
MFSRHAEQILETAVVHALGFSIETQMIRAASTIAEWIASELITARRRSIEGLEREMSVYVHAMIDWCAVCAPAPVEVDHLNQSIGATLPGSATAIRAAKSERSDRLRKIPAEPIHAAFDNRQL